MVRITEVDAHGHEIETKEEPKTRQLVNLSPADAKAVADHERAAESLIEKDRLHQAHAPLCEAISIRERALGFRHPDLCEPCLLYTSPSPRDATLSRMPSSA